MCHFGTNNGTDNGNDGAWYIGRQTKCWLTLVFGINLIDYADKGQSAKGFIQTLCNFLNKFYTKLNLQVGIGLPFDHFSHKEDSRKKEL